MITVSCKYTNTEILIKYPEIQDKVHEVTSSSLLEIQQ